MFLITIKLRDKNIFSINKFFEKCLILSSNKIHNKCIYLYINKCNIEDLCTSFANLMINNIYIENLSIYDVENMNIIEININTKIPKIKIYTDPLLSTNTIKILCSNTKETTSHITQLTLLGLKISKGTISDKKCEIYVELPEQEKEKKEIILYLRKKQIEKCIPIKNSINLNKQNKTTPITLNL